MAVRHVVGAAALVAATFFATRVVYSDDAGKAGAGAMPSEEECMKMIAERAATVEEHAKFARFAGTWDAELTCVEGGAERKSKGTNTTESLLGGRVLLSKFKGEMGGMPFEGVELSGYDKEKKQHWTIWCDSFGTGYIRMLGERNKDGNVALTSDEFDCMGMKFVGRAVTKVVDADHHDFEFVSTSPGVPENKMTIRYARRK